MGSAPGPRPLFCKKAGQKTFTWLDFCQPKPLAPGASDEISPRSGHLSGRVAAPTRVGEAGGSRNLTGAPPPKSAFLWGSTPFLWARPKKWGGIAAQGKTNRQQNGEFLKPPTKPLQYVKKPPNGRLFHSYSIPSGIRYIQLVKSSVLKGSIGTYRRARSPSYIQ